MKMIITIKMIKHLTKMAIHLMKEIMMTITHREGLCSGITLGRSHLTDFHEI